MLHLQLYANAIRKLPLMRSPWEHVIAIGLVSEDTSCITWPSAVQYAELTGSCAVACSCLSQSVAAAADVAAVAAASTAASSALEVYSRNAHG